MRTTVSLDDDVVRAIERLRAEKGLGLSEALNALVRDGLTAGLPRTTFVQRTAPLGIGIDVTNIAEVEDLLDTWEREDG